MKQPLPSDYNLTESKIKQIRSALAHNENLKGHYEKSSWIIVYCVSVAILWQWYGIGSLVVGIFLSFFVGFIFAVTVDPLIHKYFKKRNLGIEGFSLLTDYECLLAQYSGFKQKERIEEEERKTRKEKEKKRKSWEYWTGLSPYDFEEEIAELYRRNGYDAKVTPATGDGGIDIILSRDGKVTLVQCKRHSSKVGPAPVRELYGVMSARGVNEGILICPAGFTSGAFDFAKKNKIRLIGLKRIMELVDLNSNSER